MAIEKEKFLSLLDKFTERSERWIQDAEDREDYDDARYFTGQLDMIDELKDMANNWD